MCRLNIFLLLILPIFTNVHINGSQEPNDRVYVKLNDKIRIAGKIGRTLDNVREFEAFKGIRYAKAPLGTLRFQDPVPEEYGEGGVINAMSYGSSCPQISLLGKYIGDEDCLFLNIFVPKERKVPLPVMVFIHVTINYRLGALGFLSLGDDSISGNMGIKDQFESLKWIKEHIKSFGGDENSITIFGSSAGGISVLTLMMAAHKVPGLFHKVISQSTPMIDAPFMHLTHNPSYYSLLFSNEMGCDSENSIDISKCLKEKDVYELINKQDMFEKFMNFPYPWKPVVDFEYASKPLFSMGFVDLIKHGLFTNVPLLMGGTSEEGAMFTTLLMGIDEADVTDEDSATMFTSSDPSISKYNYLLTLLMVQYFYYNYRYKGSHSTSIKGLDLGASHGDELFLLFKIQDISLSTEDKKMSDLLIDYWTSFAIHGSPNSKWTPVSNAVAPKYVILNNPSSTIVAKRESYFNERMAFISSTNDIIKSYRNFDLESHPAIKSVMEREVENEEESEEELNVLSYSCACQISKQMGENHRVWKHQWTKLSSKTPFTFPIPINKDDPSINYKDVCGRLWRILVYKGLSGPLIAGRCSYCKEFTCLPSCMEDRNDKIALDIGGKMTWLITADFSLKRHLSMVAVPKVLRCFDCDTTLDRQECRKLHFNDSLSKMTSHTALEYCSQSLSDMLLQPRMSRPFCLFCEDDKVNRLLFEREMVSSSKHKMRGFLPSYYEEEFRNVSAISPLTNGYCKDTASILGAENIDLLSPLLALENDAAFPVVRTYLSHIFHQFQLISDLQRPNCSFILTEPAGLLSGVKEHLLKFLFEEIKISRLCLLPKALALSQLFEAETCIVIDSGATSTSVWVVFDGMVCEKRTQIMSIGGWHVSQFLKQALTWKDNKDADGATISSLDTSTVKQNVVFPLTYLEKMNLKMENSKHFILNLKGIIISD
ncbi:unnamed protein product [Lepeophtheirus salmonis]|uniref:(salmon louse) hypothetical protein n=1 Tax=Lepeophtheirus salmonis TaxID=72036 RepID=A0A7R8D3D8_LEPSM|nr:unnamed protein product [Lepeophtheirus salmonis]CAF3015375.1 unnamed protein product [Lepeophtheirus salmonis]